MSETPNVIEQALTALTPHHSPSTRSNDGRCVTPGFRISRGSGGWARINYERPSADPTDPDRPSHDELSAEAIDAIDAYAHTLMAAEWAVAKRLIAPSPILLAVPHGTPVATDDHDARIRSTTLLQASELADQWSSDCQHCAVELELARKLRDLAGEGQADAPQTVRAAVLTEVRDRLASLRGAVDARTADLDKALAVLDEMSGNGGDPDVAGLRERLTIALAHSDGDTWEHVSDTRRARLRIAYTTQVNAVLAALHPLTNHEPLTVHWDSAVSFPRNRRAEPTVVGCMASDGRPVALLLSDDHREALGSSLLDPEAWDDLEASDRP